MQPQLPLQSLQRQLHPLGPRLREVADRVISQGTFVLGDGVRAFESAFAHYCGVKHGVGVANGTDALELALRAADVGQGDQVVLAANAGGYAATAVAAVGAKPLWVDVSPDSATLDPVHVDAALRTSHARAVIATHLYGQLADVEALGRLCARHHAVLIEDCAQAHGAQSADGRRAGSFGALGCFSFYPTKNLGALGDGGAVVTDNDEYFLRLVRLRQYGWSEKYTNALLGGRNSRLDELQAQFLLVLLPELDAWNCRRVDLARQLGEGIVHPAIVAPKVTPGEYVAHLFVIRTHKRNSLQAHLAEHGIASAVHYPIPDYRQPCWQYRYPSISLSHTEKLCAEVLTLPCFPQMSDDEVGRVIEACNTWDAGRP